MRSRVSIPPSSRSEKVSASAEDQAVAINRWTALPSTHETTPARPQPGARSERCARLDDKDFAVELVEGDPETDDQGEMDVESRFFIRVDNE